MSLFGRDCPKGSPLGIPLGALVGRGLEGV